jgi:cephalosporin-C deacetylase-like acetyl esterase
MTDNNDLLSCRFAFNGTERTIMLSRLLIVVLMSLICTASAMAGKLSFRGETDRQVAIYKAGEKMVFKVQLLEDSRPIGGRKLIWIRRGDDGKTERGEAISSATNPLVIVTSGARPGFVRVKVTVLGDDGKPVRSEINKNWDIAFEGGAGVEPEKIKGFPEPEDFDAFWARQKAALARVPLKAKLVEAPSNNPRVLAYDVKVDCAGGKPVSGYLTKPKGAAAKSLPAQVVFNGYGVYSAKIITATDKMVFNVNAHGIENGRSAEYYDRLNNGELQGYGYRIEMISNPETAYFKGMMLRAVRALQFMKSLPEWDGKNLIVYGSSQGGFQALVAAGLDGDVSRCIANAPWCCDIGGVRLGRLRDWRPPYTDALRYFDAANHAKRIRCKTSIKAGLGDYTCPPSGLTVLYNNINALKEIEYIQGATHGYTPPHPQRFSFSSQ